MVSLVFVLPLLPSDGARFAPKSTVLSSMSILARANQCVRAAQLLPICSPVRLKLPEWPAVSKFMVVGKRSFSSMTIPANPLSYGLTIAFMARDSLIC